MPELRFTRALPLRHGVFTKRDVFFDLLIRLPKEQVWRNRGAENSHQHGKKLRVELQLGNESGVQDLTRTRMREDRSSDICDQ